MVPAPALPEGDRTAPNASPDPSSGADARPPETEPSSVPVLLDETGTPLPQTEDRPSSSSPFVERGGRALLQAIVEDDPARASFFFFPVVAYEQVKDIQKPARDWEQRLMRAFERNVHSYHRRLGRDRDQVEFVRIEVPDAGIKWMKPGSEGNKLGYFRVLRSNLIYRMPDGQERRLPITSLISWRGEWYVVHLDGFE